MGAAATLLLYDLARRLTGPAAGRVAALVWVSTYFVVGEFQVGVAKAHPFDPNAFLPIWSDEWRKRF